MGTTVTASFFDSLNPSAMVQQMLLQAMVKKKRSILFFICGVGTANLIMGLAIYVGIATWVSKILTKIVHAYPLYAYGAAGIGGTALLAGGWQRPGRWHMWIANVRRISAIWNLFLHRSAKLTRTKFTSEGTSVHPKR